MELLCNKLRIQMCNVITERDCITYIERNGVFIIHLDSLNLMVIVQEGNTVAP